MALDSILRPESEDFEQKTLPPPSPSRHISTPNIDEYSSGGESSSGGGSDPRHRSILDTSSMLYRSEESLVAVEEEEDNEADSFRALRKTGKAVSCSDLLLEFNPNSDRRLTKVST